MNTLFERSIENYKDEWLTPPHILKALGEFDLDPCSPVNRPWPTAKKHLTINDDGLLHKWEGRVWCNPPYGDQAKYWLKRCASHGNAIALTFARTETDMFFKSVWPLANGIFFIRGRLQFYNISGEKKWNAGAPSVLIAYGKNNSEILEKCNIPGKFIWLNE